MLGDEEHPGDARQVLVGPSHVLRDGRRGALHILREQRGDRSGDFVSVPYGGFQRPLCQAYRRHVITKQLNTKDIRLYGTEFRSPCYYYAVSTVDPIHKYKYKHKL